MSVEEGIGGGLLRGGPGVRAQGFGLRPLREVGDDARPTDPRHDGRPSTSPDAEAARDFPCIE